MDDNILYNKLNKFYEKSLNNQKYYIGVQHSRRIKYNDILNKFNNLHLNNIGDPFTPPIHKLDINTYNIEKECIYKYSEWINMNKNDVWGVTTSNGSEACMYGIIYAKNYFKNLKPLIICTKKSHYIYTRFANIFNIDVLYCDINKYDEIDNNSLDILIQSKLEYIKLNGVIIILTSGTTIKCGYDDLITSYNIIKKYNSDKFWIHIDACLGGFILPFLENNPINYKLIKFNSISISPYKMLGFPYPLGMFITNKKYKLHNNSSYTSSDDGTIFCSRNGQSILYLYLYICNINSFNERKNDVEYCLKLKKYFINKLKKNKIQFYHNPNNGLSIYFNNGSINNKIINKYNLISDKDYVHVYIMVNITKNIIDELINDLLFN
jgi:histidine decarboxylase